MKTKPTNGPAKRNVTVKDLKTKRNPKGGFTVGMAVARPAEFKTIGKRIGPK
jgi:hypothetical protein